jgi:hypothetical protein
MLAWLFVSAKLKIGTLACPFFTLLSYIIPAVARLRFNSVCRIIKSSDLVAFSVDCQGSLRASVYHHSHLNVYHANHPDKAAG